MTITVSGNTITFNDSTTQNTAFGGPTGVAAGTYGSGSSAVVMTIAADGRVTSISTSSIAGGPAFSAFDADGLYS
jgi:hypothetical protein